MALLFFVLAVLACTAQCKPSGNSGVELDKNSQASASAGDHESKLSPPWIKEMEGFEQEINEALGAVWPLLNFFLNFDESSESDDTCGDEMVIQLMPDDSNVTPSPTTSTTPVSATPVSTTTVTTEDPTLEKVN